MLSKPHMKCTFHILAQSIYTALGDSTNSVLACILQNKSALQSLNTGRYDRLIAPLPSINEISLLGRFFYCLEGALKKILKKIPKGVPMAKMTIHTVLPQEGISKNSCIACYHLIDENFKACRFSFSYITDPLYEIVQQQNAETDFLLIGGADSLWQSNITTATSRKLNDKNAMTMLGEGAAFLLICREPLGGGSYELNCLESTKAAINFFSQQTMIETLFIPHYFKSQIMKQWHQLFQHAWLKRGREYPLQDPILINTDLLLGDIGAPSILLYLALLHELTNDSKKAKAGVLIFYANDQTLFITRKDDGKSS